jgi:hypothetical protein
MARYDHLQDADALSVRISELVVATADAADPDIDQAVLEVLQLLRQRMNMDVVFVSEFCDGQRVFRFVDSAPGAPELAVGDSGPLEESYCQRVIDGRLPELVHDAASLPASMGLPATPFRVGAHLSTAVRLHDGSVYGTLCCFSTAANPALRQRDLTTLRQCADLVARKVDTDHGAGRAPAWTPAHASR